MTKVIAYTALHYGRETRGNYGIIVLNKRTAQVLMHPRRSNADEGISFMSATFDVTTQLKCCTKCKRELPATLEYFSPEKRNKIGLQAKCKACNAAWQRDYRALSPERVRATDKKRSQKPERRTASNENSRKRYYANPNKVALTRTKNIRRRARVKGALGSHTSYDEQLQFQAQGGKCWWCGTKLQPPFEADHIVPLSRGGSDAPENIVIACLHCNRSKHTKLPQEWNGRLL